MHVYVCEHIICVCMCVYVSLYVCKLEVNLRCHLSGVSHFVLVLVLGWFDFCFFETGFLCVALAVLELTL